MRRKLYSAWQFRVVFQLTENNLNVDATCYRLIVHYILCLPIYFFHTNKEQPFRCRLICFLYHCDPKLPNTMQFRNAVRNRILPSLRITCNSHLGFKASSFDKILLAILNRNCATKNFTTLEACRPDSQWHTFPKWATNICRANVRKLESQNGKMRIEPITLN